MKLKPHIALALLAGVVFCAYLPALSAGYIWDDDISLTKFAHLRSFSGLLAIWSDPAQNPVRHYFPLTYTMFWIEYRIWGLNPFGYHLVNIVLHLLNTLLVWFILQRLSIKGALLAAALFALHPLKVESVAWITERKDLLSGFFYLLAIWFYLHSVERRSRGAYLLSLAAFLASVLSKSITISLPLILLLLSAWKNKQLRRAELLRTIPFFAIGIVFALLGLWSTYGFYQYPQEWTFVERCLIAGRALWFYAGKLVWPQPLLAIYPRWEVNPIVWWQWIFPLTAFALPAILFAVRKKVGYAPLVAVLFFGITLGLSLGFIDFPLMVYSYAADRFQYLASLGPIVLFAAGLMHFSERGKIQQQLAAGLIGVLLTACAVKTHFQTTLYRDMETLFAYNYRYNPGDPYLNDKLGLAYFQKQKYEQAARHFSQSLALAPQDANIRCLLAVSLAQSDRREQAIAEFQTALRQNPNLFPAWQGLGDCYLQTRQWKEAEEVFQYMLQRIPKSKTAAEGLRRSRQAGVEQHSS